MSQAFRIRQLFPWGTRASTGRSFEALAQRLARREINEALRREAALSTAVPAVFATTW